MAKKIQFGARLIQTRGKSCGKIGYFMTSIVPGQETKRGFFPVGTRKDDVASVAFRADHAGRVFGVATV